MFDSSGGDGMGVSDSTGVARGWRGLFHWCGEGMSWSSDVQQRLCL